MQLESAMSSAMLSETQKAALERNAASRSLFKLVGGMSTEFASKLRERVMEEYAACCSADFCVMQSLMQQHFSVMDSQWLAAHMQQLIHAVFSSFRPTGQDPLFERFCLKALVRHLNHERSMTSILEVTGGMHSAVHARSQAVWQGMLDVWRGFYRGYLGNWDSVDIEFSRAWFRYAFRQFPIVQRLARALRFRRFRRSYDIRVRDTLLEAVQQRRRQLGTTNQRYLPFQLDVSSEEWRDARTQMERLRDGPGQRASPTRVRDLSLIVKLVHRAELVQSIMSQALPVAGVPALYGFHYDAAAGRWYLFLEMDGKALHDEFDWTHSPLQDKLVYLAQLVSQLQYMTFAGVDHGDMWLNIRVRMDAHGHPEPFLIDWESMSLQYVPVDTPGSTFNRHTQDGYAGVSDEQYLRQVIQTLQLPGELQTQLLRLIPLPTQAAAASVSSSSDSSVCGPQIRHPGDMEAPSIYQSLMQSLASLRAQFPRLREVPLGNFQRVVTYQGTTSVQFMS